MIYTKNKNRKYPHQFIYHGYYSFEDMTKIRTKIKNLYSEKSFIVRSMRIRCISEDFGTYIKLGLLIAFNDELVASSFKLTMADEFEQPSTPIQWQRRVMPSIIAVQINGVSPALVPPVNDILTMQIRYHDEQEKLKKLQKEKKKKTISKIRDEHLKDELKK